MRTCSIAWAGLYTDASTPQLVAVGTIGDGTIMFPRMAGPMTVVPYDSAHTFALLLKPVQRPTQGDRRRFIVPAVDVQARGFLRGEDPTSTFGRFDTAASDTAGLRNLITSLPITVDLRTYPTIATPGTPFSAVAALLDTFGQMIPDPPEQMRVEIDSPFGALSGATARADSTGLFWFDSLSYSFRNDSATFTLLYPGASPASWTMRVTGGSPYLPTVSHAGSWSTGPIDVDGTGVQVRFVEVTGVGSFLTELIDSVPVSHGPLPINVTSILPRYVRITPDTLLAIERGLDVMVPLDGLSSYGAPSSLYLLERRDSLAPWWSPAVDVSSTGAGVIGRARSFGEIGLGSTSDVAVPVDDITFTAEPGIDEIRLTWRLAASIRSLGFEIARALDPAGTYDPIASYRDHPELIGAGNDPAGRAFMWRDRDSILHPGITYFYVLREVKQDGTVRLAGPVEARMHASAEPSAPSISIPYPNPFRDLLGLPSVPGHELRIRIVDLFGTEVISVETGIDGVIVPPVDTCALPPGAYFYTIDGSGLRRCGMLLKLAR